MKTKTTAAVLISLCFAGMGANAQLDWSHTIGAPLSGGYSRMAELSDGSLLLGADGYNNAGIIVSKSTDSGNTWTSPTAGASAIPNPASVNEQVGNVFPLGLPNGDILIACRHLNDTVAHDPVPDGIEFFNIDIHRSSDGGATWDYLSSPINHPGSPGSGVAADQNNSVWEPFLYQHSPTETWCLYSRQNYARDGGSGSPFPLNMKRSTDNGATWGAEETT